MSGGAEKVSFDEVVEMSNRSTPPIRKIFNFGNNVHANRANEHSRETAEMSCKGKLWYKVIRSLEQFIAWTTQRGASDEEDALGTKTKLRLSKIRCKSLRKSIILLASLIPLGAKSTYWPITLLLNHSCS